MTSKRQYPGFLRWQIIGTLALLFAVLCAPLDSRAANFDFGTFGLQKTELKKGYINLQLGGWKITPSTAWVTESNHAGVTWGSGKVNYTYNETPDIPIQFSKKYTFSLSTPHDFYMNFSIQSYQSSGRQDGEVSFEKRGKASITILNRTSGVEQIFNPWGSSFTKLGSNLEAGDYVLTIAGYYGFKPGNAQENITFAVTGNFGINSPPPSPDVPLPGALVLLGTAVAGFGIWGRKKARDVPRGKGTLDPV